MFRAKYSTALKKCGAAVLALALSFVLAFPLSAFAASAENGAPQKMLHVTTKGNGTFSQYTYKLTAGKEYTVRFQVAFKTGSTGNIKIKLGRGNYYTENPAAEKFTLDTSSDIQIGIFKFTPDVSESYDIGFNSTGATEYYISNIEAYASDDESKTDILQKSLEKDGLSTFRAAKTSGTFSDDVKTINNITLGLEDYDDSLFKLPSKKMIYFSNYNTQDAICTPVTVKASTTYTASFKYKLVKSDFANDNGPGITLRVYKSAFSGVVATTYQNGEYSVSDESGWHTYTATFNPSADNSGYLGIMANSGGSRTAELYIADLVMYDNSDETKSNILSLTDRTDSLSGWRLKLDDTELSGKTAYTSNESTTVELLEYNETYFKVPESKTVKINCTKAVGGPEYLYPYFGQTVALEQGTEYTFSYKYKDYGDHCLNNGYYLVVQPRTLWSSGLDSNNNGFKIVDAEDCCRKECTFTIPKESSIGTKVFIGFYFSMRLQLDIAEFTLYKTADAEKTNLLSGKFKTDDLAGWRDDNPDTDLSGKDSYTYGGDRGAYTVSLADYSESDYIKKPTGDINGDGRIDICDLVHLKKLAVAGKYSVMADLNCDSALNVDDLTYMRQLLLGVITIEDIITPAVRPEQQLSGGADLAAAQLKSRIAAISDLSSVSGNSYYVSENGDDNNDGKSENTPLKTVAAVNALKLSEGDAVFFERGSQFRTELPLNAVNGVSYGAYGEGDKPVISGSLKNYAETALWTAGEHSNTWKISLSGNRQAGVMTFNNGESCGRRRFSLNSVAANGDYYHNLENGTLYLYFKEGNPGEYFDSIEIGTAPVLFNGMNAVGIKLNNLSLRLAARLGADFQYSSDISVSGCEFSWIGGAVYGSPDGEKSVRMGNAVQFWAKAVDCRVEYCLFEQIFDAAVTFQGATDTLQKFFDITFDHNLIEYCSMNIEFWGSDSSKKSTSNTSISNVSVTNNIVRFGGCGWGGRQRYDVSNQAMLLGWNFEYDGGSVSSFNIIGNIFDCAKCPFVYAKESLLSLITLSGNSYYRRADESGIKFSFYGSDIPSNISEFEAAVKGLEKSPAEIGWIG